MRQLCVYVFAYWAILLGGLAQGVPQLVNYQGRLTDAARA